MNEKKKKEKELSLLLAAFKISLCCKVEDWKI